MITGVGAGEGVEVGEEIESSPFVFFLSFGAHSFRAALPLLQVYFLQSGFVTSTGYALLLASQALPALFLPFFVGHIFDRFDFKVVIMTFIFLELGGQVLFCLALYADSFIFALVSLVIFGSGSCAVAVGQRALVADNYRGSEGFGIGCVHSISSVSKFAGKITIIPAVIFLKSYKLALLSMSFYAVLSLATGFYITRMSSSHDNFGVFTARSRSNSLEFWSSLAGNRIYLSRFFILLAAAHTVYLLVFHLLGNFLPHILYTHWDMSFSKSGLASSLMSFLPMVASPVVGFYADKTGMQLEMCFCTGVATVIAYLLLLYTSVTPFVPITLLSLAIAFIPTMTLAIVPQCIPSEVFGLAYGTMEVVASVGSMTGNYVFGLMYEETSSYELGLECLSILAVIGVCLFASLIYLERNGGLDHMRYAYNAIRPMRSCSSEIIELM